MALPDAPTKTNSDQTTDDPKQSILVDLPGVIDAVTQILDHLGLSPVTSTPLEVGTAEGQLALLGPNGQFDQSLIPSQNIESATTGDAKLTIKTVPDNGWVICDDGTIGSATSGATNRANADCEPLFKEIWNNISQDYAPVNAPRGISAQADWNANRTIQLGRVLGRSLGIAGAGSGLTTRPAGAFMGAEQLLMALGQMPAHDHDALEYIDGNFSALVAFSTNTGPSGPKGRAPVSRGGSSPISLMQPTSFFFNVFLKL